MNLMADKFGPSIFRIKQMMSYTLVHTASIANSKRNRIQIR